MSFQGYLSTIKSKTGLEAADFRKLAEEKGFTTNGKLTLKAGEITFGDAPRCQLAERKLRTGTWSLYGHLCLAERYKR